MYLGIDLGTTSLKIILVDNQLNVIATESVALTISHPHPLWSEQNPLDWWNALNRAMKKLSEKNPADMKKINAIGFSGQQHGAVLLDHAGNILRPAILWNDGRSHEECLEIMKIVPNAMQLAGSIIMPGFTAPKLRWVKKYEPDIFKKINKILLPKDYLRFMMSGDFATDMSDASGTAWLDVEKRAWSPELLSASNLKIDHMPQLFEGNEITGKIKNNIAHQWGLPENIKCAAGAGDNAASAISMGSVNPRVAYLSLGTSATFFIACEKFKPNPTLAIHTFCHAVPHYWHHMTVHLNGASNLTWITNLFGMGIAELLASSNHQIPHNENLIFLPYLSGERTPHNNPHATGAFFGLNHSTNKAAMTMAVLEGTIFGIALGYEALMQDSTLKIDEISVVGGGSQNDAWGIMFASALQRPLTYRKVREVGSAFGAAKLAWMADDEKNNLEIKPNPEIEKILQPDDKLVLEYEKKLKLFKQLYKNVRPLCISTPSQP